MKWTFWTRTQPALPDDCRTIDPLVSLYADEMTSAEEARRVEAHLPGCAACRESLAWMQATQRALAARPVVSPPADLRARIAAAIAASSAAPVPALSTMRPARAFVLRPAFAAAASLTVLGVVISYGLLHQQPHTAVHSVKQPMVAVAPPVSPAPTVIKPVTGPGVKPTIAHHAALSPKPTRFNPDLVARAQPDETQPEPVAVKTPAEEKIGVKAPAEAAPVMVLTKPHLSAVTKPLPAKLHSELMATTKPPTSGIEMHRQPIIQPETKKPDVVVATIHPAPSVPSTPALIEKRPVVTQDLPPTVASAAVASAASNSRFRNADLLGPVKARLGEMPSFTHTTVGQSIKGAVFATRSIEPGGTAYVDGIHSR